MAHLGLRPKMLPKQTVLRFSEEIYEEVGKLTKRQFQLSFRDEHGFSTFVHRFFKEKLENGKCALKKTEQVITNFIYSVDSYKEECMLCLLFAQLLAEIFSSDLLIFASELRMMIQSESRKSTIRHL